jgi:nitronate monooxygenase
MEHPLIIQGGMGAGVSNWKLAREVAINGQIGVVSGVAIDVVFARRLQDGDLDGQMRRALQAFPFKDIADKIFKKYYVEGGIKEKGRYMNTAMPTVNPPRELTELTVLANFAEVYLAKEGHDGKVGINLLEKIQVCNLASLYGAMLAGVDYVIMGAGIPREIPGILDLFSENLKAEMKINVEGALRDESYHVSLDPKELFGSDLPSLKRPEFLAIISSNVLATTMIKKATGKVNGFVIEYPIAGGHNAPPRGGIELDASGEPIYGEKDAIDLEKIKSLDVPFWLAGAFGEASKLKEALMKGAAGVQLGTAFAFCKDSGLDDKLRKAILALGKFEVKTDILASPTGFPFKVLKVLESLSESVEYAARPRICNLGYLRTLFRKEDGTIGYRCPAEPINAYIAKGGAEADTVGRKCLCNGLLANIGQATQYVNGYLEKPLITAGSCFLAVKEFMKNGNTNFTAKDVIDFVIGDLKVAEQD